MLTVVVLTYNSGRTIDACLRSLDAQRRPPAEILIVDDDSADDTLRRVEAFRATAATPVRVLRNGSHNIARGRNIGMAGAHTRLVAFVDSDARVAPDWAGAIEAAFEADPGVAVVGGSVSTTHASRFAEAVSLNDETVKRLVTSGALLVSGCNMAVDLERVAGHRFDERWVHAEDIEYVDRIRPHGRWSVTPAAHAWHESRAYPRAYFRQMYRYGLWKVRYSVLTGHVRAVDYVPAAVLVAGLAAAWLWPPALLALPALSLAETAFVAAYRRPRPALVPLMAAGWLVKNAGWGLGVLTALAQQLAGRSGVPPRELPPRDLPARAG